MGIEDLCLRIDVGVVEGAEADLGLGADSSVGFTGEENKWDGVRGRED